MSRNANRTRLPSSRRLRSRVAFWLAALALVGAILTSAPASASAQDPYTTPYGPGFAAEPGGNRIECLVRLRRLQCLNYRGNPPADASCDFGGTIQTLTLRRARPVLVGFVCVDEGFHDYTLMPRGGRFHARGFRCRLRKQLTCHRGRRSFSVTASGGVTRR